MTQSASSYWRRAQLVAGWIVCLFFVYQIGPAFLGFVPDHFSRGLLLVSGALLIVTVRPTGMSEKGQPLLGFLFDHLLIAAATFAYMYWGLVHQPSLMAGDRTIPESTLAIGALGIVVALECARRAVGWPIPIIVGVILAYSHWGSSIPGLLGTVSLPWSTIILHVYGGEGMFGFLNNIVATYVIPFIVFGRLMSAFGAEKLFVELPYAWTARTVGGSAKLAVVSSGMLGGTTGNPPADVVASGTFTIPLMKRSGFRPQQAGAFEAVASTGSELVPPVLGTSVIFMSQFLGVPYTTMMLVSIGPAILYYFYLYMVADLEARRAGVTQLEPPEFGAWTVFRRNWPYAISFVVLVYFLIAGRSVPRAAFAAIVATLAVGIFMDFLNGLRAGVSVAAISRGILAKISTALTQAGALSALMLAITAALGILIGMVELSGFGFQVSSGVIDLTGGSLFVTFLVTGMLCFVLGSGVAITPLYILMAVLIAPALIDLGVEPLVAHMSIFCFLLTGVLTPPVGPTSMVAASLAGAPFWATGFLAVRYGILLLILPWVFLTTDVLMSYRLTPTALFDTATALVALVPLAAAIVGHWRGPLSWPTRLLLAAVATALFSPFLWADMLGAACLLGLLAATRRSQPAMPPNAVPQSPQSPE